MKFSDKLYGFGIAPIRPQYPVEIRRLPRRLPQHRLGPAARDLSISDALAVAIEGEREFDA